MSRLPPHFGPFEPLQRLGAGGMAETFLALRRGPGGFEQRVCIKRILPAYESDREFVQAFLLEARTSAQLRHANIVQVLDFGVADESHYLALELIDGVDLRALLRTASSSRPLPPELVVLIGSDVALALDHAHGGGPNRPSIVHRDVSPSNVLASRAGEVKLTDFGIARAIGGTHHTATGVIKGKVPYLPPEYIERGEFGPRSDLFSLGVMLHELVCGERPFDGESDLDTVRHIVSGDRRPLAELAPGTPPALIAAIERLLAVDPQQRFGSARELLDALPPIIAHRARLALGELVRMQLGELDTGPAPRPAPQAPSPSKSAAPSSPAPTPAPASPYPSSPSGAVPAARTRTVRPQTGRLSRGARVAGISSLALLVAVLGVALARFTGPSEVPGPKASVPRPPALPVAEPLAQKAATEPPPTPSPTPPEPATEPAIAEAPARSTELVEVRVIVSPFGDVWIDGRPRGPAPVTVRLSPGTHEVAWGDGRPRDTRVVQVKAGQRENIVFRRDDIDR